MTAARNGYFFVVDRVTGEHLAHQQVRVGDQLGEGGRCAGQAAAQSREGSVSRRVDRVAVRRRDRQLGATGVSPDTGLFYVSENNTYSIFYLLDTDPRGSMGLGGKLESRVGSGGSFLTAIDYKTGKAAWRHTYEGGAGGGGGVLATAGKLVFAGDGGGNIVAHDALTGKPLWHSRDRPGHQSAADLHD